MASEKETKEKEITLDAINWKTRNDFYRDFCIRTSPPKCWGNTLNLDAFRDSLDGDGVLLLTPKKIIIRNLSKRVRQTVGEKFFKTIEEICTEMSVELETYTE